MACLTSTHNLLVLRYKSAAILISSHSVLTPTATRHCTVFWSGPPPQAHKFTGIRHPSAPEPGVRNTWGPTSSDASASRSRTRPISFYNTFFGPLRLGFSFPLRSLSLTNRLRVFDIEAHQSRRSGLTDLSQHLGHLDLASIERASVRPCYVYTNLPVFDLAGSTNHLVVPSSGLF